MNHTCPWCTSKNTHLHLMLKDYFLTQEPFEIVQCDDCGLLFTIPRPAPDAMGRYYKSEVYFSHRENNRGFIPRVYESVKSINMRHKVALATSGLSKGKLLDIGCGVGDFIHSVECAGWQCVGIEPSADAITIAQQRVHAEILSLVDLSSLDDGMFDVITMWHVLEHVDDLHSEIVQLHRLLKPGGRLVVAVPNYCSYDADYYQDRWAAYDVPRHLNHFSKRVLFSILQSSGFVFDSFDKLQWDAFYISYMSEKSVGHSLPLVRGFFTGLRSNLKARKTGEWSSLVFVFHREK